MEILEFLKLVWPILLALVGVTLWLSKMQTQTQENKEDVARHTDHLATLLTFMNKAESEIDVNTKEIERLRNSHE